MTQEISEAAAQLAVALVNQESDTANCTTAPRHWIAENVHFDPILRAFARYIDKNTATVRQPIPDSIYADYESEVPEWAWDKASQILGYPPLSLAARKLAALIAYVYPEPEQPHDLADLIVDDVKTILGGPAASSAATKLTAALRQALEKHGIKGPPQP